MKQKSGIICHYEGIQGILRIVVDKTPHPANGAHVEIVTNRFSNLEMRLTRNHGIYTKGTVLQMRASDFIAKG